MRHCNGGNSPTVPVMQRPLLTDRYSKTGRVWASRMPRSAIIWTRSRELSLKARYHRTQSTMISWSKCRPLNRSCAEVGSVIAGRYRHKASFSSLHQNLNKLPEDLVNFSERQPHSVFFEKTSLRLGEQRSRLRRSGS